LFILLLFIIHPSFILFFLFHLFIQIKLILFFPPIFLLLFKLTAKLAEALLSSLAKQGCEADAPSVRASRSFAARAAAA